MYKDLWMLPLLARWHVKGEGRYSQRTLGWMDETDERHLVPLSLPRTWGYPAVPTLLSKAERFVADFGCLRKPLDM